jgi:hypothetical protein
MRLVKLKLRDFESAKIPAVVDMEPVISPQRLVQGEC